MIRSQDMFVGYTMFYQCHSKLSVRWLGPSSEDKIERQKIDLMDILHNRPKVELRRKIEWQSLVAKCCKIRNIYCSPAKFANFVYICILRAEKVTIFELKLPWKW